MERVRLFITVTIIVMFFSCTKQPIENFNGSKLEEAKLKNNNYTASNRNEIRSNLILKKTIKGHLNKSQQFYEFITIK